MNKLIVGGSTTDPNAENELATEEQAATLYLPLIQHPDNQAATQLVDDSDPVIANDTETTTPPAEMTEQEVAEQAVAEQAGKIYLPLVQHSPH